MLRISACLLAFFLFASCFGGVDKRGSVLSYNGGIVKTEGGSFRIGTLPADWKPKAFSYRALLFLHKTKLTSITVDSFCKDSVDDGPLDQVAKQLFYSLSNPKIRSQKRFTLEGRDAIRQVASGNVDGADVVLDAVVLKMNECVFDFAYVASPADYASGVSDFEALYKGFRFIRGPRID